LDTTQYLPDLKTTEVGSPAQENLRFALQVVEDARARHAGDGIDLNLSAYDDAIGILRFLTGQED
jgi:hypothetical protein